MAKSVVKGGSTYLSWMSFAIFLIVFSNCLPDDSIMFLPFESIYAEVIRRTSLIETLQKEYKIVVTGPTTLGAILNSLQMGFRTLAIQKRTGEVWTVLGAVKTEFSKFGGLLEKVQKNLQIVLYVNRENLLAFFVWQLFHLPQFAFDGTCSFSHDFFELVTSALQVLLYFFK